MALMSSHGAKELTSHATKGRDSRQHIIVTRCHLTVFLLSHTTGKYIWYPGFIYLSFCLAFFTAGRADEL